MNTADMAARGVTVPVEAVPESEAETVDTEEASPVVPVPLEDTTVTAEDASDGVRPVDLDDSDDETVITITPTN